MYGGNGNPGKRVRCAAIRFAALAALALVTVDLQAQMGPVRHNGFVEYQHRLDDSQSASSSATQLATWRGNFATYMWQPWVLTLDANLGLTRSYSVRGDGEQDGGLVTGGLFANLFPRSHFPFRAYFETRDSRVDGDLSDLDIASTTFGFLQQYAARGGGRYSIDFRHNSVDELYEDGFRVNRQYVNRNWQFNASKAFERNDFRLLAELRNVERDEPMQMEDRNSIVLRHRYRTGPRFFIEDTTFLSHETLEFENSDLSRRFLQWNGISTWRPDTEKPLYVTVRGLMQATESGPAGMENGSTLGNLNAAGTYQYTENVTLSGNLGVTTSSSDMGADETVLAQRLRGTYRSDILDLWASDYRWGASLEAGNTSGGMADESAVQDFAVGMNHSLSKSMFLRGDRQLQFSFSQQATTAIDTADRQEFTLINGIYTTLSRQNGRTSSYLRFSLTDRRLINGREESFQLANLQASLRTQVNRTRSWNGSITLQAGRNAQSEPGVTDRANSSISYSANLNFTQRDLFDVQMLNFMSELRWLSTDFQTDDPFDMTIGVDPKRDDRIWRNRLEYRIGRLEFRLNADVRQINSDWMSQVFLQVRRYYGAL